MFSVSFGFTTQTLPNTAARDPHWIATLLSATPYEVPERHVGLTMDSAHSCRAKTEGYRPLPTINLHKPAVYMHRLAAVPGGEDALERNGLDDAPSSAPSSGCPSEGIQE